MALITGVHRSQKYVFVRLSDHVMLGGIDDRIGTARRGVASKKTCYEHAFARIFNPKKGYSKCRCYFFFA